MTFFLKNVFRIDCNDCGRHWLYDDYINHKRDGRCVRDANASNNIASLYETNDARQKSMKNMTFNLGGGQAAA